MSVPVFTKEELRYDLEFAGIHPLFPTAKRYYNTPITQKENLWRAVHREGPLWIPKYGDWICFAPQVIPDTVAKGLVLEYEPFNPKKYGGPDIFGVPWVFEELAGGSMPVQPRKLMESVNEWEEFLQWPDVDAWDWEGSAEKNREFLTKDLACQDWFFTGFFERLISLMDFQGAAMAMIDEEQTDAIHAFFSALADLYDQIIDHLHRYLGVDYIIFHDDAGTQRGTIFSPETHRELIVPYLQRVADSCHKRGMLMELHSCGKNDTLADNIAATGADMWTPQSICDIDYLYEKIGDRVVLGINSDLPGINPMTPEDEAIASAKRFVQKYGPHMDTRPVISASWGAPVVYSETIYEESRKYLQR